MTRVILQGCCGKMGRMVTSCCTLFSEIEIVAGVDHFISDPPLPYPVYSQADEVLEEADVIVDFSRPEGLTTLLTAACDRGLNVVLATTGLSPEENLLVDQAAEHVAIFQAANLSVGIKAMQQLLQKAVGILGDDSDIEIIETHHNQKVDAPSGTALALADSIRQAFGEKDKHYVFGRYGRTSRRERSEIGIHALRGGTVTGEHEVFFFGQDEVLSLKHHAASRQVFAMGALKAARFLHGQAPGRYDMDDLLSGQALEAALNTNRAVITVSSDKVSETLSKLQALGSQILYHSFTGGQYTFVTTQESAACLKDVCAVPVLEGVITGKISCELVMKAESACNAVLVSADESKLRLWMPLDKEAAFRTLMDF